MKVKTVLKISVRVVLNLHLVPFAILYVLIICLDHMLYKLSQITMRAVDKMDIFARTTKLRVMWPKIGDSKNDG